jgi:hypothetical protein
VEGGHIAEILDKASGVNPLWIPPWRSIEPSTYTARLAIPSMGPTSRAGCSAASWGTTCALDLFGPPSEEEAAAGVDVHGEASVVPYEITASGAELTARCRMPIAQLAFERQIRLVGRRVAIVGNRGKPFRAGSADRVDPGTWTLAPPFLEHGATQFRAPSVKSQAIAGIAAEPRALHGRGSVWGSHYTLDGSQRGAVLLHGVVSPSSQLAFGYVWRRADFPWLGVWEENRSRTHAPWNGLTLTTRHGVSAYRQCPRPGSK